jgi:hypothetical protein
LNHVSRSTQQAEFHRRRAYRGRHWLDDRRFLRADLVGLADRAELPADAFPDGIRIHFHFDGVYNGCKAAGKGTRMDSEIIQKELAHDDERYNPITDKNRDVNKGAEGLDCVHEMNTINHYVGMFPIATGAPVEKPLAKFFFAFFTVMLSASWCHVASRGCWCSLPALPRSPAGSLSTST